MLDLQWYMSGMSTAENVERVYELFSCSRVSTSTRQQLNQHQQMTYRLNTGATNVLDDHSTKTMLTKTMLTKTTLTKTTLTKTMLTRQR